MKRLLAASGKKYGTPPATLTFGDSINWDSELLNALLYVELPFWLMIDAGALSVTHRGVTFNLNVCPPWIEAFGKEFTDSRISEFHNGPSGPTPFQPSPQVLAALDSVGATWMLRRCKTVLRLESRVHVDAVRARSDDEPPRAAVERE